MKTIKLTDDQFNSLFEFVDQRVDYLVENLDEIKDDFKGSLDSDIFEYPEDSEIECPMVLQPVEWTTGYGYKEAE